MALSARQPFAEIGTPRLQALSSAKNRQNAISPNANFTSPLKPTLQPSTGKRRATAVFEDDDSENLDPSIFNSPTKKSKTIDGLSKPSKFSLVASPSKPSFPLTASPPVPSVRKALSSPNTSNSTPINHSRGSPKHKRVGALSKRRASSSPFRRVDPPSFSQSSPALPFSIDAALSGTIPNYTPKSSVATPVATPVNVSTIEESMPKSWFFEIHEDTPEQEAANLMEHSAAILDISSDDDVETKRRNEELERGKENIPPSDFLASQPRMQQSADVMETNQEAEPAPVKRPRLRNLPQDAMDEDRKPLSDLAPADYYGEGLDATSYVTVDATLEKPSGLSKEFDFSCPTPEKKATQDIAPEAVPLPEETESSKANENIPIFSDESTTTNGIATVLPEEAAPAPEAASQPQETASTEP